MKIIEATIHQLRKDAHTHGEGSVTVHARERSLAVDETLRTVCGDLLRLYAKSINGNGTLGVDTTIHAFPILMAEYRRDGMGFHAFTIETLKLISREMETSPLANGGFALFLRYAEGSSDFLLIAMLKLKPGAGINEESLDLEPTLNIDLGLLNEAARINLARMDAGEEPYLTFVKGSNRGGDVTEYFRRALACDDYTSSRHHTDQVIKAAEAFVKARSDLTNDVSRREQVILMHKRLHECFSNNSEEIVLDTLAAAIHPSEPVAFKQFIQPSADNDGYEINHAFKPDRTTYNRIKRISVKMGTVSIGFDVADVQSGRVAYDTQLDAVVLKDPTDKLKQAIAENAASTR